MKSKFYRVFAMLLAIAVMIPSFALAAETITAAKLEITSTAKAITDTFVIGDANKAVSDEKNTIKYAYDIPSDAVEAKLTWTSSNEKVATVNGSVSVAPGDSVKDATISVWKQGVGTATIKGKLVVDNGTPLETDPITVTFTAVDVTKIEFAAPAGETIKTKYKVGENNDFSQYVKVTAPETGATYDRSDVAFRMTDGTGAAEVDKDGYVTFKKAGTATLQAYIPGSSATPATLTLTVIPEDAEDDPQDQPENVFTYLAFTSNVEGNIFTTKNADFDLSEKLVTRPAEGQVQDKLIWSVDDDDASIASVDNGGWVRISKPGAKVKVTVASQKNPDVTAYCYVEYVKGEDSKKAFTTVEFKPASATVRVGEQINLYDYLITKGPDDCADEPVWTTLEDPDDLLDLGDDDGKYTPMKAGAFKVTVRSKLDPSKTSTFTINAVEEAETEGYTKVEFSTDDTLDVKKSRELPFNISDYLVLEGDGNFGDLIFTSSDTSIATVSANGENNIWVEFTKRAQTGDTVKIEVRYKQSAAELSDTLTLKFAWTEADEKYTKVEFRAPKTAEVGLDEYNFLYEYNFNAFNYLVLEGKGNRYDLIWTSSDERIATVNYMGYVSFKDIDWDEWDEPVEIDKPGAKDGATVKITVRYQGADNKTFTDTLTVNIKRPEKPYTSLKFSQETLTVTGDVDLSKYLLTEGNEFYDDSQIWTTDNQQIARVSNGGDLEFTSNVKKGDKVKVTVRSKMDPTKTASITVTYEAEEVPFTKITLTQDSFTLDPNKNMVYLTRYIVTEPEDATDELVFTTDDTSVLRVSKTGEVSAEVWPNDEGTAKVTVRSKLNPDLKQVFTFTLKGEELKSIKFVDVPKTLYKGFDSIQLPNHIVTDPVNYSGRLVWDSSDPTVAGLDEWGNLYYVGTGTVTVTVSDESGKVSDKCTIEVKEKYPVEEIILKDITMKVGESYDMEDGFMTVKPAKAVWEMEDIKWTSSNRDVAEVQYKGYGDEENGDRASSGKLIVAYKAGTTKITATFKNDDGTKITGKCKVTVEEVEIDRVKIAEDVYTLKLNAKKTAKVRFNIMPEDCSIKEEDIYVESSDENIVKADGLAIMNPTNNKGIFTITAQQPGTAWVSVKRVSDDKKLDACKVVVKAVAVKSVKWQKDSAKLYWYDDGITEHYGPQANTVYRNTVDIKPIITPANAYCNVSFETSDPSVAFVNNKSALDFISGDTKKVKIEAVGVGTCKITIKVDDGNKVRKAVLKVTVEGKKAKLKMSETKATLKIVDGKKATLKLRAYDANTDKDLEVKWASSDKKVAKVNSKGVVTAVGAGKATITATTKEGQKQTVKCTIIVKEKATNKKVLVKSISSDKKITLKVGEKKTLSIKVKPKNATNARVTFASSDAKIVSVDENGKLKAKKAGKATITVTAKDGSGVEFKITVVVKKK